MMEQATRTSEVADVAKDGSTDWRRVALLLALVLPLRVWLLANTEVAARDSIGFIRYALQFETKPWTEVVRNNHQHPGYPLAVWAVSQPVQALAGTDPITMRISAQLASALAALALLIPMYFLGKELFDREVGFWGALFFQYLPVSGHHLSDGISESLFLFLTAMALWRGVLAVRKYQPREFAWSGLWGGLAYLTRPEGAVVVLAVGLMLIGLQLAACWRKPWPRFVACGVSLSVAAGTVGGIYVVTTGKFTNKLALGGLFMSTEAPPSREEQARGPMFASVFGVFFKPTTHLPLRVGRSLGAMGSELNQSFNYVGWVPALAALYWGRTRFRRDPGFWVLAGYCLLHSIVLFLLAMVQSYVSDRHVMVLVLCGSFFAVAGIRELAAQIRTWFSRRSLDANPASESAVRRLAGLLVMALILVCLPKTGQRLHGNRVGNRVAGIWLAGKLAEGDMVDDDHAYSHYYAGQVFVEDKDPPIPKGVRPTYYVVVSRSKEPESDKVRKVKEDHVRARAARVFRWPENSTWEDARVVIYAGPRDFTTNPWRVAP
jgi:hypothetical protein